LVLLAKRRPRSTQGWRADDDYYYWTKFDMGREIVKELDAKIIDSCLIFC